jgi:hypothetical protein
VQSIGSIKILSIHWMKPTALAMDGGRRIGNIIKTGVRKYQKPYYRF